MLLLNTKRNLPSFTLNEIWDFVGERGVYSESPQHFLSCFDVLSHYEGKLYYRMKLKKDRVKVVEDGNNLFQGTIFHDPMEYFINRKETGDNVVIMTTHHDNRPDDEEICDDVLENDREIPFSEFEEISKTFKLN